MNRKLRAFLKLSRIDHGIFAGIVPVATYILTSHRISILTIAVLYITTLLAEIYLFVLNDIMNIQEDKINRPDAPLVKGEITIRTAWLITITSLTLSIIILAIAHLYNIINTFSLTIYATAIVIGTLYNIKLKKYPFVGNLATSLTTALAFLYGLYSLNMIPILLFLTSLFACLGREIIKSIIDIEGDKLAGLRTLPIVKGIEYSTKLAKIFEVIALALFLVTVVASFYILSIWQALVLLLGFICALIILEKTLFKKELKDYEHARKGILKAMFMVIMSYFFTCLPILV